MQKQPAAVRLRLPRLTAGEALLAVSAAVVGVSAFVVLPSAPLTGVMMLLAAAAIVALVYERVSVRRALDAVVEQLDAPGPVGKLEVELAGTTFALGHALNRTIQRVRAEASAAQLYPAVQSTGEGGTGTQRMLAVLYAGLRNGACTPFGAEHIRCIGEVASAARDAGRQADVVLVAQGDGSLLLLFGAQHEQPRALSLAQALVLAATLGERFTELRFGLACGEANLTSVPSLGGTIVGTPLEDAARLGRMAVAWHEYRLLAAEPVALMARAFSSRRTQLELSLAAAPALPVYAVDLVPAPVALSA